jgi:tRNA threonylcarbamoyladenosine biosynthesis protein TsaE
LRAYFVRSEGELKLVAKYLSGLLTERPVVTLSGDLGTGKTTLVKAVCQLLEVVDEVSSPTFGLVNVYLTRTGRPVYHLDLYRVKDPAELTEIGIDDYLYSGEITFIEWPEIIAGILPENTIDVWLEHVDKETRKIVIL